MTARPEYSNKAQTQENNLKNNFIKMIEVPEMEIKKKSAKHYSDPMKMGSRKKSRIK